MLQVDTYKHKGMRKQLIAEFPIGGKLSWVHVSYDPNNLKNEILVAKKLNGKTVYIPYKSDKDLA